MEGADVKKRLPVLPSMHCDDGCGKCCGPVPVTAREGSLIRAYIRQHAIVPAEHDNQLTCPLFDGSRCLIHPVRPLLCRVFGHTPRLECAHGHNVNVSDRVISSAILANGKAVGLVRDILEAVEPG